LALPKEGALDGLDGFIIRENIAQFMLMTEADPINCCEAFWPTKWSNKSALICPKRTEAAAFLVFADQVFDALTFMACIARRAIPNAASGGLGR
jgi:hypothetical protein